MAHHMPNPVEFVKPVIYGSDGRLSDQLKLPLPFVERFGDLLPRVVVLKTMDGEEFRIYFRKQGGIFSGMQALLSKLLAKELQILRFRYLGEDKFEVYILDKPSVTQPFAGNVMPFQCMFFKAIANFSSCWKPMELPEDFLVKFGRIVPRRIKFHLTDGTLLDGLFDYEEGTVSGLQKFFKVYNMTTFESLVITYAGKDVFLVHGFGTDCMQKYPLTQDCCFFEVEIKPSHLQQYDFGVTIPSKFHHAIEDFGEVQTLEICHVTKRWRVVLKKRGKRAELHGGWSKMWKDLKLEVGDICLFRRTGSIPKFELDVYKYFM